MPESRLLRRYFPLWHLLLRLLTHLFAPRFRTSGWANVPKRGAVIFAPNHTSDSDPFFMFAAIERRCWWMTKKEIYDDFPALVPLLRFAQAFPVDQKGMDRTALDWALQVLARGESLVVFPEGHCSADGQLQPLEPGVALLAMKAGVPIVPVGMCGASQVLPYAQIKPKITLGRVRVHFGKPISLTDLAAMPKREARKTAIERLEIAIRKAMKTARET